MKKYILNQTMSRNGGSLICQLLEGNDDIFHLPFNFRLAIDQPQCWPFNDPGNMSAIDFCEKIMSKIKFIDGEKWHSSVEKNILEDPRLIYDPRNKIVSKLSNLKTVNSKTIEDALEILLSELVNAYGGNLVKRYEYAKYILIDADHSFICDVNEAKKLLRDVYFIQVIRNAFDVLASRKNMLLFHSRKLGNPKLHSLKEDVIYAEIVRWYFSVVKACRDYSDLVNNKLIVQFEALKRSSGDSMKPVADFLSIKWSKNLQIEGLLDTKNNRTSQYLPTSSLNFVTKGKKKTIIGSFNDTLNDYEIDCCSYYLGGDMVDWPIISCPSLFIDFLKKFIGQRSFIIEKDPRYKVLASVIKSSERMAIYSSLNYGKNNVDEAFL